MRTKKDILDEERVWSYDQGGNLYPVQRDDVEYVMDQYAREVGIEYANWIVENVWRKELGYWYNINEGVFNINDVELFLLFINQYNPPI